MGRLPLQDLTTPDGLFLKTETKVCVPGLLANADAGYYQDAATYDPYRYTCASEQFQGNGALPSLPEAASGISQHFVTFGYGDHVSPRTGVQPY